MSFVPVEALDLLWWEISEHTVPPSRPFDEGVAKGLAEMLALAGTLNCTRGLRTVDDFRGRLLAEHQERWDAASAAVAREHDTSVWCSWLVRTDSNGG